jgi:hypothetical protein
MCQRRVRRDRLADACHAGRVGQSQIALRDERLAGPDRELSGFMSSPWVGARGMRWVRWYCEIARVVACESVDYPTYRMEAILER